MANSKEDELYSEVADLGIQDGQEENIYSDADGEDYDDVKDETDEFYQNLDNKPQSLPDKKLIPQPPPLTPFITKDCDPQKSIGLGTFQTSPACLGLNSVRIRNAKDGLRKVGILKENSTETVAGENQLPLELKKCTGTLIENVLPPSSVEKIERNNDKNRINKKNDDIGIANKEQYKSTNEKIVSEHQIECEPPKPAIRSTPIQNSDVQPPPLTKDNYIVAEEVKKLAQPLKMEDFDWYWDDIDRVTSEARLKPNIKKDGFFLIRKCKKDIAEFVISLTYNCMIYHLIVRRRTDGQFSVGYEKQQEKAFAEVWELVDYYKISPLELLPDESNKTKHGWVKLTTPIYK